MTSIDPRDELVARMNAIRQQGLGVAQRLSYDVRRLQDWREHVRSNPLPFMLTAAMLGYLLVPGRRATSRLPSSDRLALPAEAVRATSRPTIVSHMTSTLRGLAISFANRWVRTKVNDFVQQYMNTLSERNDDRRTTSGNTWSKTNRVQNLE